MNYFKENDKDPYYLAHKHTSLRIVSSLSNCTLVFLVKIKLSCNEEKKTRTENGENLKKFAL